MHVTELEHLDNLTEEFIRATHKKTHMPVWAIDWILKAAARLLSRSATLGREVTTPIGYCGILVISDLYPIEGRPLHHAAFPHKVLIPYLFDDGMIEWGYDFVPSSFMRRALRLSLRKHKTFNLIDKRNQDGIFRLNYGRCHAGL